MRRPLAEPELAVKRRCRHGELHAHSGSAFDTDRAFYCTEADTAMLKEPELRLRLFSELAEKDPRLTIDEATVQADKITGMLFGLLKTGGSVEWI